MSDLSVILCFTGAGLFALAVWVIEDKKFIGDLLLRILFNEETKHD